METASPYRDPQSPSPAHELTTEEALGVVIGAIRNLSDDEKENVLLAAASLYSLNVEYYDPDDTERKIALCDLRDVLKAVRSET